MGDRSGRIFNRRGILPVQRAPGTFLRFSAVSAIALVPIYAFLYARRSRRKIALTSIFNLLHDLKSEKIHWARFNVRCVSDGFSAVIEVKQRGIKE
jgi:hypothetical protein